VSLPTFAAQMLPAIEAELQLQVARLNERRTLAFHQMLTYHMGWSGEGAGAEAAGKRVRPLMALLATAACGADWQPALPAAAALELVHNFSLVHDDIQDHSEIRRGRQTLWVKWGAPMAINAGDALFVLSNLAILDLERYFAPEMVLLAASRLHETCLHLTRGQFLDMSYEQCGNLGVEDYWPMVEGKTAALLSAACHIGALLGGAGESDQDAYRAFGHALGLAFQVQDDILGIWGDEALTGKSTSSDLVEGKKSLPVLRGLSVDGKFAQRWKQGAITPQEAPALAETLASEGAYEYTHDISRQLTGMALTHLRTAAPRGEAGAALMELAEKLLKRQQ